MRGLSLTVTIFTLLVATTVAAVAIPALSAVEAIDGQVRRAGESALCDELNGIIENWDGNTDAYVAAREHSLRREGGALLIHISSGSGTVRDKPHPPNDAHLRCPREMSRAEENQFPRPELYVLRGSGTERFGARIEEEQSGGGARWAAVEVDIGGTLKAAIKAQLIFALATLALALSAGAMAARAIGHRMRAGVRAVNATLASFATGHHSVRAAADLRDTSELIDLKQHVNTALGEIASQTEARETAAKQIVHDIRSPLGKVEMWLRPHAEADAKIARASAMVADVIEGTRLILASLAGKGRDDRILSLSDAVSDHVHDYAALAAAKGIELTGEIDADVCVSASRAAVDRVLDNLLQNVLDHGAAGAATLELHKDGHGFTLIIKNAVGELAGDDVRGRNFGVGLSSVGDIAAQYEWTFDHGSNDGYHRAVLKGPLPAPS